jgi:DDE superfamily endonuclease
MITYMKLRNDPRQFLALTSLTPAEFQTVLTAFARAYERHYPADRTLTGQPRQRFAGGGRTGVLHAPEQKLLFLLVYLKAYPLQAVMAELFGLSQPGVNYWLHRLLPVLHSALDDLGVLPERDPRRVARHYRPGQQPCLIIDGTDRRRQRPKNHEKQAAHYSGKKKAHCDRNVVLLDAPTERIEFLSPTYAGKVHDKKIADEQGIAYPPGAVLYQDTGFQGYQPAVQRTCQPKKKATRPRSHAG